MTGVSDPFDLTGKVIVVTGGSRGLGKAMCRVFAERGADVVIASRKLDNCEELAKELGGNAMPVACHVGRWADCDDLFATVYERFGKVDVLVNNAGMSPLYPSLGEVTEELFDKVMNVNYRGPFRLSSLFGERMKADGKGSIINVSSIASVQPGAGEIPYAGAKAALNNMTLGLARAFAPAVRVNCIMPGMIQTDIADAWDPALVEEGFKRIVPLQRIGQVDEFTSAALYFASDASAYTTGAILKVDGGLAWSAS